MSILHDLSYGSPGMNKATELLKTDSYMASAMAHAFSTMFLDKPLIRCQNCTKTAEEVGRNAKFMVCSNCKSKLNFPIHYWFHVRLPRSESSWTSVSYHNRSRQGMSKGRLAHTQETLRKGESREEARSHHSRPVLGISRSR